MRRSLIATAIVAAGLLVATAAPSLAASGPTWNRSGRAANTELVGAATISDEARVASAVGPLMAPLEGTATRVISADPRKGSMAVFDMAIGRTGADLWAYVAPGTARGESPTTLARAGQVHIIRKGPTQLM